MNDGGKNLEDFVKSNPNTIQMEKFWIEVHRLFLGLTKFIEAGVVHHDLKHLNIVYNTETNRINIIDFGLMTSIDEIKTESENSEYGFAKWHWSFPPEIIFYNKNNYESLASGKKTMKQKEYLKFLKEIENPDSSINYFITVTSKNYIEHSKEKPTEVLKHLEEYHKMLEYIKPNTYNAFLDKSIITIDSYGLAHSLIYVLNETKDLIDSKMTDDLHFLFYNMLNFNVFERVAIIDAMSRYEDILENSGLLKKYKKTFELHELKNKTVTSMPKKISIPKVKISKQLLELDPKIFCPEKTRLDKQEQKCKLKITNPKPKGGRKTSKKP